MKTVKLKSADLRFILAMVIATIVVIAGSMAVNAAGTYNSKGIINFGNGVKFDASDITTLDSKVSTLATNVNNYYNHCQ